MQLPAATFLASSCYNFISRATYGAWKCRIIRSLACRSALCGIFGRGIAADTLYGGRVGRGRLAVEVEQPPDLVKIAFFLIFCFFGCKKSKKITIFTRLNHILTATHGKKLAVIENEFGDVSIDDKLLAKNTKMQVDEKIIEMMNGCICCKARGDLVEAVGKLADRANAGEIALDGIIIETTGN